MQKFLTVKGTKRLEVVKEILRKMIATAEQSPRRIGKISAECAYRIFNGEPVEKIIKLPTRLLSVENITAADLESWD
jgi:ribose transport system substrate-binding protein